MLVFITRIMRGDFSDSYSHTAGGIQADLRIEFEISGCPRAAATSPRYALYLFAPRFREHFANYQESIVISIFLHCHQHEGACRLLRWARSINSSLIAFGLISTSFSTNTAPTASKIMRYRFNIFGHTTGLRDGWIREASVTALSHIMTTSLSYFTALMIKPRITKAS